MADLDIYYGEVARRLQLIQHPNSQCKGGNGKAIVGRLLAGDAHLQVRRIIVLPEDQPNFLVLRRWNAWKRGAAKREAEQIADRFIRRAPMQDQYFLIVIGPCQGADVHMQLKHPTFVGRRLGHDQP